MESRKNQYWRVWADHVRAAMPLATALLGVQLACAPPDEGGKADTPPAGAPATASAALTGNAPIMRMPSHQPLSAPAATPQLAYNGGRVLSHVKVVTVLWGSGVSTVVKAAMPAFYETMTNSPYMDWLSEYNTPASGGTNQMIGRGSLISTVTITPNNSSTSLSDGDIQTELGQQIDSGALPASDNDTLYMVHFPPGVIITAFDRTSCIGFCAYHFNFSHGGQDIAYGVMPDQGDAGGCTCGSGGEMGRTATVSSHELIEAVTDPDFQQGWWSSADNEIGDICELRSDATQYYPGTGYNVSTLWSNQASQCVIDGPRYGEVYTPGDFNGDGKTDLIITNGSGSYWYFSNGDGTWNQAYTRTDLPTAAASYVTGDFNGDGKTDMVITTAGGSYWYFSNGDGTWNVPYTRTDLPIGVATYTPGDFNGDGKTDLIITTGDGSYWYFSNGDGTWNVPYTRTDLVLNQVRYVPGDFNGDGKTDLVILNWSGSYWYFSNGDGSWTFPYTRTELTSGIVSYTPGDFNGDGKTDLVISDVNGSYWYFSNGDGTWNQAYTRTDLLFGLNAYVPADFNGDGLTDLIITNPSGSYWYFSNGDGSWNGAYTRTDLPRGIAIYKPGDFNGDGRSDQVITTPDGSYWYFSNGDGSWTFPYTRTDLPL